MPSAKGRTCKHCPTVIERRNKTGVCATCRSIAPVVAPEPMTPNERLSTEKQIVRLREDNTNLRRDYAHVIKQLNNEDRIMEMFGSSIRAFPSLGDGKLNKRTVKTPSTSGHYEVPMLLVSDQQIGEEISFEETYGINAYNFDVFLRRLEVLENRTLDILNEHQRADFPTLVINSLGDNISGRIHQELQKYGHQHIIDQVYLGALAMAMFVYRLAKFGKFSEIIVNCVSGNHGRLDKEKESKKYYKNFDYMFHNIMALALRDVKSVTFNIPQCLFMVAEVAKHRVLVSHGHELPPSSLGIPLYSINRASAAYQELLSLGNNSKFDYWVMGHYHRPLELDGNFVNGTMAGLSEFGIGKFKPILPMQRLMGFHTKWGRAWEYPVRLDKTSDEQQVYKFTADMTTADALDAFNDGMRA